MGILPPLVALVGPTAVGKTFFAIHLALRLGAEIVSADSRLFYKGMDIGTAKPSLAEQRGVAHHLIDVVDPDENWSLQQFQNAAHQAITDIHSRGRLPILVGGTGQYVRAVVEGWQGPPVPPNPELRAALEHWSTEITPLGLHQRLALLDAKAAAGIDPQNLRRTVRALEVIFSSGQRFSAQRQQGERKYRTLLIGLQRPREELYKRIDLRIESMFSAGFIDEVNNLLSSGVAPDLPAFSAIGYHELTEYLNGKISLDEAKTLMRRRTRVFVRRQANWFNANDPDIHWFPGVDSDDDRMEVVLTSAEEAVRRFLTENQAQSA